MVILATLFGAACTTLFGQNDQTDSTSLFYRTYRSTDLAENPTLVLVLHGDAPFNNPSYQYGLARKMASENGNTIAVGVLRPGYTDNEGNHSPGERGDTTGDNYTQEVLSAILKLTQMLKAEHRTTKVVLIGHSGGAAISANLISLYPNSYSGALLISCPCDVHAWREHMKGLQPEARIWDKEISSLSPIEEVGRLSQHNKILMIHGGQDPIVPVGIVKNYVERLEKLHKDVELVILETGGHEIAFAPTVFEFAKKLMD